MIVNGNEMNFESVITVSQLLQKLELDKDKVVVEVDLDILAKDEYKTRNLNADSKVEIIRFVGGG